MHRAFVSSMLLVIVCACGVALAQSEFKPGQGNPPAPAGHPASASGASGRGRVTMRVAIGESAPDFELAKLDGQPLRLSSLRGGWVLVCFVESRDSLSAVEPVARALKSQSVRTLGICYDKPHTLPQRLKGRDLAYTPLADPTGEIVWLYGLMDPDRDAAKPGIVLVDPKGDVKMALLGQELPPSDAARLVQFSVTGE